MIVLKGLGIFIAVIIVFYLILCALMAIVGEPVEY